MCLTRPLPNASELRGFYSVNKCCSENCMIEKIRMPVDKSIPGHFCSSCSTPSTVEAFESVIAAARETIEEVVNDSKELTVFLMNKFENKYTPPPAGSSSSARGHYIYEICIPSGTTTVCRNTFMSVYGLSKNQIDTAQQHLRKGHSSQFLNSSNEFYGPLTFSSALSFFELDHDYYMSAYDVKEFVKFDHVPDTNRGLLCAAWMMNYFDLLGENEVSKNYFSHLII